jgi:hypothetical protein
MKFYDCNDGYVFGPAACTNNELAAAKNHIVLPLKLFFTFFYPFKFLRVPVSTETVF